MVRREGDELHPPAVEQWIGTDQECVGPLLHKDRVIVFQELNGGGFIAALDKRTGEVAWKTPRKETVGWGSPIAITVPAASCPRVKGGGTGSL